MKCPICIKRNDMKKKLESFAKTSSYDEQTYLFNREKYRTRQINIYTNEKKEGYVDKLKECPGCDNVLSSGITNFHKTHHMHTCPDCNYQSQEYEGELVNDDLTQITNYGQIA